MNASLISRGLLAAAAILLIAGGAIHAAAFSKVAPLFDATSLSTFLIGAAKALWLADSSNLLVLGAAFGVIAFRPASTTPLCIGILAAAPLASAVLIYMFVGSFFAGHLMLVATMLALTAAVLASGKVTGRSAELTGKVAARA